MAQIEAINSKTILAVRKAFSDWWVDAELPLEAERVCCSIDAWLYSAANGAADLPLVLRELATDVARLEGLINRESQAQ